MPGGGDMMTTTEPLTDAPLHPQPMPETPLPEPPLAALPAMTEDALWRAVEARDARLDGLFVYAVRSTGIYCRPSCPSRRPRRDQVAFFPVPEAAERAGFRPCRRCRPGA